MNHYTPDEEAHWRAEYLPVQPEPQWSDYARMTVLDKIVGAVIWIVVVALAVGLVATAFVSPKAWEWLVLTLLGIALVSTPVICGALRVHGRTMAE